MVDTQFRDTLPLDLDVSSDEDKVDPSGFPKGDMASDADTQESIETQNLSAGEEEKEPS